MAKTKAKKLQIQRRISAKRAAHEVQRKAERKLCKQLQGVTKYGSGYFLRKEAIAKRVRKSEQRQKETSALRKHRLAVEV